MASRTLLALTTPVAAHAIAQTAYHRREPMHAPGAIDESGRCPDHHAAARLGNAETASATPAWATARRTSSTLTARPVRHPANIALPHPRLADDRLPGWRSPCGARREEEEASIVNAWTLVRFVHVLSAMVWVGGQLLLSPLVLPVLRRQLDTASRGPLAREVGVRFGIFTVAIFLPLQLATGIALAAHRGVTVAALAEPGYRRTLGEKLTLFAVVL